MHKLITFILFYTLLTVNSFGQENEYMLKAGFMEKFARFTTWPKQDESTSFKITVIGNSPFGNTLTEFYQNIKVQNKNVVISFINSVNDIDNPDILFICASEASKINEILSYIKGKPILTIGDTEGFAKQGVHINFYETEQQTIHFKINQKKVKQAGLKIDALLLSYAIIVG